MIKKIFAAFVIVMMAAMFATPSRAADDDTGLYDPKPPAGAAFVRFFNADAQPRSATVGARTYTDIASRAVTPYGIHLQGVTDVVTGLTKEQVTLQPGMFYTLIADAAGNPYLHKDTVSSDPAKSMIVLYNIGSDAPLSLKAQDGMVTVLENVQKGKSAHRGLNGVKVGFTVTGAGGVLLDTLDPLVLERGRTYSVFYAQGKAVMVKGDTDTAR